MFCLSFVCLAKAHLVKAIAAPTYVRSCVQEVQVQSLELANSTLASIPLGLVK